ncbi:hypothetical protein [Streptomyces klenkii]
MTTFATKLLRSALPSAAIAVVLGCMCVPATAAQSKPADICIAAETIASETQQKICVPGESAKFTISTASASKDTGGTSDTGGTGGTSDTGGTGGTGGTSDTTGPAPS